MLRGRTRERRGEGWKRGQKRVRLETKGIVWTRDACGHCHVLRNGIRDIADFFLSWNTEKFVSLCMPRNRDKSKQDRFLYIFWTWKFLLIICINIMIYIYLYLLIIIVFIIGLFIFVFLTTFERDGFIKKSWIVYLISILYICNIVDYKYLLIHL